MAASTVSLWLSRLFALVLAAAAMGSAVAWGLKLRAPLDAALPPVAPAAGLQVDAGVVAHALGAPNADARGAASTPAAASRLALVGVVAHGQQGGAALIAVDGKPPKPVAVGARVGDDWVLASVAARRAVLRSAGGSSEEMVLDMPLPATLTAKTAPSP